MLLVLTDTIMLLARSSFLRSNLHQKIFWNWKSIWCGVRNEFIKLLCCWKILVVNNQHGVETSFVVKLRNYLLSEKYLYESVGTHSYWTKLSSSWDRLLENCKKKTIVVEWRMKLGCTRELVGDGRSCVAIKFVEISILQLKNSLGSNKRTILDVEWEKIVEKNVLLIEPELFKTYFLLSRNFDLKPLVIRWKSNFWIWYQILRNLC